MLIVSLKRKEFIPPCLSPPNYDGNLHVKMLGVTPSYTDTDTGRGGGAGNTVELDLRLTTTH